MIGQHEDRSKHSLFRSPIQTPPDQDERCSLGVSPKQHSCSSIDSGQVTMRLSNISSCCCRYNLNHYTSSMISTRMVQSKISNRLRHRRLQVGSQERTCGQSVSILIDFPIDFPTFLLKIRSDTLNDFTSLVVVETFHSLYDPFPWIFYAGYDDGQ